MSIGNFPNLKCKHSIKQQSNEIFNDFISINKICVFFFFFIKKKRNLMRRKVSHCNR